MTNYRLLTAAYEDLSIEDRAQAIDLARQAGEEAAAADRGAAGGVESVEAPATAYFRHVVEPAWHAEQCSDADLEAWRDGDRGDGDPRKEAFDRAWSRSMQEALEEMEAEA